MTTQGHFVYPGGPADGRLVPSDQLVKINNVAVDDLTPEQAAEIIRSTLTAAFTLNTTQHTHMIIMSHEYWYRLLFEIKIYTSNLTLPFFFLFRECQDSLTMTVLRTMLVSLLDLEPQKTETHIYTDRFLIAIQFQQYFR